MEANGLQPENILFTDGSILGIIRQYNPGSGGAEPGAGDRASICRKVAREIVTTGKRTS
jgi:ATP-dependent Lon protease